jgi:CBS domain-containing protein
MMKGEQQKIFHKDRNTNARNRISGIPVVNTINNLVGIITKTDIIRRLAEEA